MESMGRKMRKKRYHFADMRYCCMEYDTIIVTTISIKGEKGPHAWDIALKYPNISNCQTIY